jgi:hypothetical protein
MGRQVGSPVGSAGFGFCSLIVYFQQFAAFISHFLFFRAAAAELRAAISVPADHFSAARHLPPGKERGRQTYNDV